MITKFDYFKIIDQLAEVIQLNCILKLIKLFIASSFTFKISENV